MMGGKFVERERAHGFLVFKSKDYRDIMKGYDEKRLELVTLQERSANSMTRRKYLRMISGFA